MNFKKYIGKKVIHTAFGEGKITKVDKDSLIHVDFENKKDAKFGATAFGKFLRPCSHSLFKSK